MTSSAEINQLAARVSALEARLPANSWLFGDSLLKRIFAIWGHYFLAQLTISIVLFILFFVCTVVFGLSIAGLTNR
jgi:hypothetical protein